MRSDRILELAMRGYVAALRDGSASPYECLRFVDNRHEYRAPDRTELTRQAVMILVQHDPLLLITTVHGSRLEGLGSDDIEACLARWSIDDAPLASLLEGHLWLAAARGSRSADRTCDPQLTARALAALDRARPGFADDLVFLDLYATALELAGDDRYPTALDELLDCTPAEWRAFDLLKGMRDAVGRQDWSRYDALRTRWQALPRNSHSCECYHNYVANIDGLRALDRGDREHAVRCLHAAADIAGCPHLNSGGATLLLARRLVQEGFALAAVGEHLDTLAQFRATDELAELRRELAERTG